MVYRNRTAYAKLSVTVVLSLSFLLLFLIFTDSRLYNKYKEVYAQPSEIVLSNIYGNKTAYQALLSQIATYIPEADYYGYTTVNGYAQYENGSLNIRCSFLPSIEVPVYEVDSIKADQTDIFSVKPIKMVQGKEKFDLKGNEVIINESWYNSLIGEGGELPLNITIQIGSPPWQVKVVGVCEDSVENGIFFDEVSSSDVVSGWGSMYLSAGLLSKYDVSTYDDSAEYSVWINTQEPEKAIGFARALGLIPYGVYEAQQSTNAVMKVEIGNKAYISAVILLLLGLNLYSSFSNALHERRYEIGVKRALGAGISHIMRQFIYESIAVLLLDTLISVIIVVDLMIGYKAYQTFVLGNEWIVYISLSTVFSLIFAYKSTQVEIIKYLRDE